MVKKLIWMVVLAAITSFIVWSKSPLNDTVNFIIGGSIPGTKVALGFWPTLGIIAGTLLLIRLGIKSAQMQMIESATKQSKADQAKSEFKDQNSGAFDPKNRSVIAARSNELSV